MSYAKTIEPQILTIEAIIQKSEYKSKLLNNIPVDLKKLFMDQLTTSNPKTRQTKRQPTTYENTHIQTIQHKDSQTNQSANTKIRKNKSNNLIPPLPHSNSLHIKSQSLNISKQNPKHNSNNNNEGPKPETSHNQTIKTTRTYANSREGKRVKKGRRYQRNSLGEEGSSIQKIRELVEAHREQKKLYQISKNQNEYKNPEVRNEVDLLKQLEREEKNVKKFCRFEYQLVLPEKQSKNGGFHKVSERRQKKISKLVKEPSKSVGEQILTKNNFKQQQKGSIFLKPSKQYQLQKDAHEKSSFLKQNLEQKISEDTIPDFVIATITQESRNQTVKNVASTQLQFHFDQFKQARHRIIKPPTSVVNMKKKMSYNRVRKSQESGQCQEAIEPKVSFMKLIQKQKQKEKDKSIKQKQNQIHQRSTQAISKEKKFRSKHRIPHFDSKKLMKANFEQEVKGWEAGWEFLEPHFDIQ